MNKELKNKKIKNLFVVDWKNTSAEQIESLLTQANLASTYDWSFYNCHSKNYTHIGIVNRYFSYLLAVFYILKNRKKYANIIIWQQMIGMLLCFLPKVYSTPKIIITTLLYSPSRVKHGSFRLFLLKKALKNADALLYFSKSMADDVKTVYPKYKYKVFSTYLPITNIVDRGNTYLDIGFKNTDFQRASVFSGGLSDRDFETLIKAFTNTNVPVTIVCTQRHIFKNPLLITSNFNIVRNVSEREYFSLALSSNIVVITLENKYSSCGQLLFTFCMKNGIPIIATDCYGTRDYITNNENGILIPVKDDKAILSAYNKLITEPFFRESLIKKSQQIAKKMTFSNYLYKIDSIIRKL